MKIILNKNNVVVAKSETAEIVENGIFMGDVIFGEHDLKLIDSDLEMRVQQDLFVDGVVIPNPKYVAPPPQDI